MGSVFRDLENDAGSLPRFRQHHELAAEPLGAGGHVGQPMTDAGRFLRIEPDPIVLHSEAYAVPQDTERETASIGAGVAEAIADRLFRDIQQVPTPVLGNAGGHLRVDDHAEAHCVRSCESLDHGP